METYLSELKRLVLLHARSQGIPCQVCHSVLSQIKRDEDGDDGWADAWMAKGDHLLASGEAWQAINVTTSADFLISTPNADIKRIAGVLIRSLRG